MALAGSTNSSALVPEMRLLTDAEVDLAAGGFSFWASVGTGAAAGAVFGGVGGCFATPAGAAVGAIGGGLIGGVAGGVAYFAQ